MEKLIKALQQFAHELVHYLLYGILAVEESNTWKEHQAIMAARKDLDDFMEQHRKRMEEILHRKKQ